MMKEKKGFIIAIAVMAVVIIGLVAYIVVSGKKKTKENETTTAASTTEEATTEADASDGDAEKDDKKGDKDSDKKSSIPDTACYVTISDGGNWKDGDMFVYQYNVTIHNDSSEDLKDWKVEIDGFKGGEIGDHWNAELEIKGDKLTATAVDYNQTLAKKSATDFGMQVKFEDEDKAKSEKNAVVYIDGKEYTAKREEPTTQSKEEKEEAKKEKIEPESGTPLENHGKLSIKGTDIVDKSGKPYQLKGVSTHGLAWFPDYVNKDAFKTFRDDWGANLIRLAMYTGESGGYCADGNKDQLKGLVKDGVEYATELGMYVIIDWHILSDNNPKTNEAEAVAFFDEMSAAYADYDNVIYEICNEPNGSTSWADIKSYAETVISVIRANDKDAIIIVGTPTWSQDVDQAAADPLDGDNICYTVHFYAATHKENIRSKVDVAHDAGLCVFISEFSICDASGNGAIDYGSADEWFALIDKYNLSYAGWNVSNKDETSSLIKSSCSKTSDWTEDDLSETGIWLREQIKED